TSFFYDVAEPVLQTRGQIYQYVGDEVVVTWTTERGLRQGNCLRCVFLVTEHLHEQKERYLARYGIVPAFKAGLHGGPVVTAEIGDIKKDIVHSGDTVNTAARVEAQCRPLERRVLVSEALLSQCQLPEELEVEDMGKRELRGKAEALRLFSVRRRTGEASGSRKGGPRRALHAAPPITRSTAASRCTSSGRPAKMISPRSIT